MSANNNSTTNALKSESNAFNALESIESIENRPKSGTTLSRLCNRWVCDLISVGQSAPLSRLTRITGSRVQSILVAILVVSVFVFSH